MTPYTRRTLFLFGVVWLAAWVAVAVAIARPAVVPPWLIGLLFAASFATYRVARRLLE